MKKKLLITLGTVFVLFVILFIIQIFDEKINGDDYSKIKEYSRNVTTIVKNENYCTENSEEIFKMMFDDNYKNTNISLDKSSFDKRIESCKYIIKKINEVEIPDVKSKNKKNLMIKFKKSALESLYNFTRYFEIYNSCPERNAKCMENYKLEPAEMQSYGNVTFSGIKMLLKYSIKDILIIRPLIWWFENSHNKNTNKYTFVYTFKKE